jgi:hypothetical protein
MIAPSGIVSIKGIVDIGGVASIHVDLQDPFVTCGHPIADHKSGKGTEGTH